MDTDNNTHLESGGPVEQPKGTRSAFVDAVTKLTGLPAPDVKIVDKNMESNIVVPPEQPIVKAPDKPAEKPAEKPKEAKPEAKPEAKAKPEEKPAEKPKEEKAGDGKRLPGFEDAPANIKSEKGLNDWKSLRTAKEAAEKRIAELEAKLSKPELPPDYEEVKKQNAELLDKIKVLDVTQDPRFQKYFSDKATFIAQQIRNTVGEELAGKVISIMANADPAQRETMLEDVIGDQPAMKQSRVAALGLELDRLNAERNDAIANAKNDYSKIEQQRKTQAEAARREWESTFDRVSEEAREGLEVLKPVDGNEEHNSAAEQAMTTARALFLGQDNDPETLARAAVWASAAPLYRNALVTQKALIQKLEAQLAEYQAAKPTVTSNQSQPKPVPANFIQRVMSEWQPG